MVTILPVTLTLKYQFSAGTIGLCYLANGVGNTFAAVCNGVISDRLYAKAVKNNGGKAVKEFRLRTIYIGIPIFTAGAIMYGWFLEHGVHWSGILITFGMSKCSPSKKIMKLTYYFAL
jgi:hypothetical protein